jgi:adenylate cyclase
LRECISRSPNARAARSVLAATYARLGRNEEARAEAAEVLRIDPHYRIGKTQKKLSPFKSSEHEQHLFDGLRKAGLPE